MRVAVGWHHTFKGKGNVHQSDDLLWMLLRPLTVQEFLNISVG